MILHFVIFFGVVLAVFGGANTLVAVRLASLLELAGAARSVLWGGVGLLAVSSMLGLTLSRRSSTGGFLIDGLVWVGSIWMGMVLLLLTAILIGDIAGLASRVFGAPAEIVRALRLGLIALAVVGSGLAVWSALSDPKIHEVEVRLPGLPAAFDGYRIAHVTDTHIGPTLRRSWVQRLVARVDSAKTDLVVHTGDFIDGSVERLADDVQPFSGLRGKDGIVFVTGNHEAYSNAYAWGEHLRSIGFRVLLNENFAIEREGQHLVVLGVTDLHEGNSLPERRSDVRKALEGAPDGLRILLAHQPVQARDAQGLGIALQLSGHTHGGQIWPFHHLVKLAQPVVSGFGQVGDILVFVSNGAGYWGPPMRLFAPPEVPILVLRRA